MDEHIFKRHNKTLLLDVFVAFIFFEDHIQHFMSQEICKLFEK